MRKKKDRIYIFEQASIPSAIVSLCVPTVLATLVTVLYSLADTYFVGLMNDPLQTAAVSLASPVLLAFNAVNNLFGVGGSSMMSRALGRKDYDTLRTSGSFSFWGAAGCGIIFSLLCTVFRVPLLNLVGADATTAAYTNAYMNWTVTLGAVPAILNVVMAYLIRSEGAAAIASAGTMSGCLLNMILDPIFIMPWGLNMGVEGAAAATMLSNTVACLVFLGYIFTQRGKTMVCIDPRALKGLKGSVVKGVFGVGMPASIQNLLNVTSQTTLNVLAAPYGAAALAAMGICKKVDMVPMFIVMGASQGIMPLISYNYASKNYTRMKKTIHTILVVGLAYTLVMMVLLLMFPAAMVGAFIEDPETVAYGAQFTKAFALVIPVLLLDFTPVGVFQAVGMGKASLILAIVRKLVLELPLLFILNWMFPLYGLPFAQTLAEAGVALVAMIMMMRLLSGLGKEEKKEVIQG